MDRREIPVAVLREAVLSAAEVSSLRQVADECGLSRSTVHKFATADTVPHPRVRRLLALWYLSRIGVMEEEELVRPYAAALDKLVDEIPMEMRMRCAASVLEALMHEFNVVGEPHPAWMAVLRKRIV